MEAFAYLSVLVSIIVGLGMSHILGATVRLIHNRSTSTLYLPSVFWAISLFLLFTLVWWADFSLVGHRSWTFGTFVCTLSVPSLLYVACGLVLPGAEVRALESMRQTYFENRTYLFPVLALSVALSFVQTYLLDGHVKLDADAALKAAYIVLCLTPAVMKAERVQRAVSVAALAWVLIYITFLFNNLRS